MKLTRTDVNLSLALLRWVLPLAAAWYAYNKIESGISGIFKPKLKTLRERFSDSQISVNFGAIGLMSHDLDTDYQMTAQAYEAWRSLHPDNEKLLSIVLDPMRRVKPQFIQYIDAVEIDEKFLRSIGQWH